MYFFIVSLQIQDILKCGSGVDVDHISIDSSKQMAPVAERTLRTNAWKISHHSQSKTCIGILQMTDNSKKKILANLSNVETHLTATAYSELLESPDVIDEQSHETEFVWESHQDVESSGVKSYAVGFLLELLIHL